MTQETDPELAGLFARAAAGDAAAQYELGEQYLHGPDDFVDRREGLRWIRESAERGYPHAQFWLSSYHERGDGGEADPTAAFTWAERAARQGLPQAHARLSAFLSRGYGVARDLEQAARWEQSAAEIEAGQGSASAMYHLGEFWREGRPGHPADAQRAVTWYEAAIRRGETRAMLRLARLCEDGVAVPRDEARAVSLYERAGGEGLRAAARLRTIVQLRQRSAGGDAAATWELANALGPDTDEGVSWLQAAARLGHVEAARALFGHYTAADSGRSVSPEGRQWIQVAADLGVSEARAFLARSAASPPPQAEGESLIDRLRAMAETGDPVAKMALASLLGSSGSTKDNG